MAIHSVYCSLEQKPAPGAAVGSAPASAGPRKSTGPVLALPAVLSVSANGQTMTLEEMQAPMQAMQVKMLAMPRMIELLQFWFSGKSLVKGVYNRQGIATCPHL